MRPTLNIFQHGVRKKAVATGHQGYSHRMSSESFQIRSFTNSAGPVVLSVPHAGRDYPEGLTAKLRVPLASILPLEDRFADQLVDLALIPAVPTIIANVPRLIIDLNRAPDDLDPDAIRGDHKRGAPASAKARAGLGLIPTRLASVGPLWRAPFGPDDVGERLRTVHAPYHDAIAHALALAKRRWATALLIDLHSMPPLAGPDGPDIVIGDRFGNSAGAELTATAETVLTGLGFRVAINAPYAGGYIIARHADPRANVHALQIEIDRRLYLDAALDQPGPGMARMQDALARLVHAMRDEMTGGFAAAAE
jgi:N-formylglutamate amidohydrolase